MWKKALGILLILSGVVFLLNETYTIYTVRQTEEKNIEDFFMHEEYKTIVSNIQIEEAKIKYIAILEIPKISLKKGLVDINSEYNNVDENITILKESSMPNISNSNLILAAHSGNSYLAFFKDLNMLEKNDIVNIYYSNVKYIYIIKEIYYEKKNGEIIINQNPNTENLIMTTCDSNNKKRQLVIIAEQIQKKIY